ncbi:MAG: 8-oxo-dGTP diphosphatase [Paraglaciecola sp.]
MSVDLIKNTLKYENTFTAQAHGYAEGILVRMTCYSGNYEGILKANSEIEEIIWLAYSDIDKVSPVDKIIFDWLRKQGIL